MILNALITISSIIVREVSKSSTSLLCYCEQISAIVNYAGYYSYLVLL